jgi:hypothetical protein
MVEYKSLTWYQKPLTPASTARPCFVRHPADKPPGFGLASSSVTSTPCALRCFAAPNPAQPPVGARARPERCQLVCCGGSAGVADHAGTAAVTRMGVTLMAAACACISPALTELSINSQSVRGIHAPPTMTTFLRSEDA